MRHFGTAERSIRLLERSQIGIKPAQNIAASTLLAEARSQETGNDSQHGLLSIHILEGLLDLTLQGPEDLFHRAACVHSYKIMLLGQTTELLY